MTLKQFLISKGFNRTTVHWWLTGKRPVSRKHALILEDIFKIDAKRFVWPDVYGNPWPEIQTKFN